MLRLACLVLAASVATSPSSAVSADQNPPQQGVPPVTLPPVVVTAQKEPADAQRLPVSVSAVTRESARRRGLQLGQRRRPSSRRTRSFAELSARKVSNPFIRGIGSSPSNPGVTTYIDGVPQLNANSSNIELLDIEQIEFVRGPQSALFGRNALGGLVNVTSGTAVDDAVDGPHRRRRWARSASARFAARCPARSAATRPSACRSAREPRRLHGERRHRPHARRPVRHVRPRPGRSGCRRPTGRPGFIVARRARPRRRLRAERPRRSRAATRSTRSATSRDARTATSGRPRSSSATRGRGSRSRRRPACVCVEDATTSPTSTTRRCRS